MKRVEKVEIEDYAMRKIEQGTVAVSLDEKSLMVTLEQEKTKWSWKEGFRPYMECEEGELFFDEAASISHETISDGNRSRNQKYIF